MQSHSTDTHNNDYSTHMHKNSRKITEDLCLKTLLTLAAGADEEEEEQEDMNYGLVALVHRSRTRNTALITSIIRVL